MSQTKKKEVAKRILNAARQEFIKKGYLKASLRAIAESAQITLSNLYNYYRNKNDLFTAVLSPRLEDLEQLINYGKCNNIKHHLFETLAEKQAHFHFAISYIQSHQRELNLLFNQAAGSALEDYPDYLANHYVNNWGTYFKNASKYDATNHYKKPSKLFLYCMAHFHLTTVSNLLKNPLKEREIKNLAKELATFLWHGGIGLISSPQSD